MRVTVRKRAQAGEAKVEITRLVATRPFVPRTCSLRDPELAEDACAILPEHIMRGRKSNATTLETPYQTRDLSADIALPDETTTVRALGTLTELAPATFPHLVTEKATLQLLFSRANSARSNAAVRLYGDDAAEHRVYESEFKVPDANLLSKCAEEYDRLQSECRAASASKSTKNSQNSIDFEATEKVFCNRQLDGRLRVAALEQWRLAGGRAGGSAGRNAAECDDGGEWRRR